MKILIVFGAFLIVSGHNTCRRNSGLMKSIQYQLKLEEENNGNCDCGSSHDKKETRIGFLAWNSKDLQNIPKYNNVMFNLLKTNEGKAYNPTTGTFTAPIDGMYSFSWTVTANKNMYFFTYLDLNGQEMARNYVHATKDMSRSGSQSVVVFMKKDDKVVIKTLGVGQYMHNDGWSTFSGFLIN